MTGLASPLIFYAFILWEHALSVGLAVLVADVVGPALSHSDIP